MRAQLWYGLTACAMVALLFLAAAKLDLDDTRAPVGAKTYRVAILPICNPGTSCDPDLPAKLGRAFFSHPKGVAAFIKEASNQRAFVAGTTTSWLRPRSKLKSSQEVIDRSDDLINLARDQIELSDYDVIFLYANVSGRGVTYSLPLAPQVTAVSLDRRPGLALMVNIEVSFLPNDDYYTSAIVPSTLWANELLHIIGLQGRANSISCEDMSHLSSCQERAHGDPFSTLGQPLFSVVPNWSMKRALKWSAPIDIMRVMSNGVFRIDQNDEHLPKALEIILPKPLQLNASVAFDRLFLEQKTATGFDKLLGRLRDADFLSRYTSAESAPMEGALLYLTQFKQASTTTALLDVNPNSPGVKSRGIKSPASPGEMVDALLTPKRVLKLFDSPITLQVESATSTSLTVKVSGY